MFTLVLPGVKNADENELRSIASEPDNTHVYNVADFNIMSSIVEGLTKTVCEQVEQQDKDIKESKETMRPTDRGTILSYTVYVMRQIRINVKVKLKCLGDHTGMTSLTAAFDKVGFV